ncbi:Ig-like domain-containing protein [Tropicibacter naphthalenivorans]|uniref:Uncharacterized protein n=1 Tax=Tropicibacter naphthalenivorans TaxID=441103 RepID=A0A0P1GBH3_9RHOB|nr:Ig-like domain-containing protein [Tropicibacter naphthalenivorans]CUH78778.1 hypothetical protein TRN7648_02161 [Tropicibacter naphthalenivorans]SMC81503.1 Ig-like domain (group 3) [Tropicibacter naphthalenivorans]
MSAIDFVIRTRAGALQRGSVGGSDEDFLIDAGAGNDISLHIRQSDLRGYDRAADDLLITLADGRVIVLEGYFDTGAEGANRLFISADGILNEVSFVETDSGALFAQYGPTETWGKWSPTDELIYVDDPQVVADVPLGAYDGEEEQVSMLATGLLGAATGLGATGVGAGLAGAAVIGSLGGGGGDGGTEWTAPTVDNPDANVAVGGGDNPELTITGTANPGSEIVVTVGDKEVTVIAGEDGTWEAVFTGDDFPDDGVYDDVVVIVTDPNGTITNLDGPSFEIDTTPPAVDIYNGTTGAGDLFNAEGHEGGVTISGTAEGGTTLTIEVEGHSETVTVGGDGTWSFTFDETVLPGGEYTTDVKITVVDGFGNVTVITDVIEIDTIPHPLTIDMVTPDNVINGVEADAGFMITGTSTPGAVVTVTFEDLTQEVLVAADGTWELSVTATDFPGGEYTSSITVSTVDLAGNASSLTTEVQIDTVNVVEMNNGPLTGDDMISGAEYDAGITLTGTTQAGATVEVTIEGVTQTFTAGGDGAWSVTFAGGTLPGGTYDTVATIVSTDLAGNASTMTHSFTIDTEATVTIDTSLVAGDGVINASEYNGMIAVTGAGEPGATIEVSNSINSWTTTVGADGSWSITLSPTMLDGGPGHSELGYTSTLYVTSTDLSGNTTSTSGTIDVDLNTMILAGVVDADGVINAAERADGVVLNGGGEPGAAIVVTVSGEQLSTTVDATGMWSVTIPASVIPEGEASLAFSATATDLAGNTATASGNIAIDTVANVAVITDTVEGDGIINDAERADGVTLTGQTEPGNTVTVTMGNITHTATVAANGSWTVDFSAAELPVGERTLNVTANATDPAGNTATATGTVDVDTLVRNFAITSDAPGGADGIVNAAEAADGLTLTGTTEPGGSVVLNLGGQTVQANVAADGSWTATFSAAQMPSGEQTVTLTATSTDAAGNTDVISQNVRIDTDAGLLTISAAPVEGDDVVNAAEASDGVVLTGTSTPGQLVDVTMGGVTHTVQTGSNGIWTAPFAASEVQPGTYVAQISATITDSAGNTLTRTDAVNVDTEVVNFAASGDPVEGDNVINATEASNGFILTGTTEPGSIVNVTFEGLTIGASVSGSGAWSVVFPAPAIDGGEYASGAVIETIDPAGNPATTSVTFSVDTYVNELTSDAATLAGDGVINAAEAAQGVTLSGTVEAGSDVTVTFGGMAHVATVQADGSWTVDIPPAAIPTGTLDAPMLVEATDPAGNTTVINETVHIDTDAPDVLTWLGYGRDGTGVDEIRTEITEDTVYLGQLDTSGAAPTVTDVDVATTTDVPFLDRSYISLDGSVPDGTHLVLASTDAAGNTSGSLLVTDDPATNQVLMSDGIADALGQFQIETIDLHFAEDSRLTITEEQILALSTNSDTVTIEGGSDDAVTITGAQATGTQTVGTETYNVFTLGDATVLVDDDIHTNTGII